MREVICTEFVYFSEIVNKTGSDFDLLPMPTSDQLEDEYKAEDFDPIKFCNESTMNTIIFYDVTQYMFQKFGNKIEKMTKMLKNILSGYPYDNGSILTIVFYGKPGLG